MLSIIVLIIICLVLHVRKIEITMSYNDCAPQTDHRSILDKDKTAQVILDLAGKTRHSDGLREPDSD